MSLTAPHVTVDVPFADTSADDLRFSLDRPRIAPLASEIVDLEAAGVTGAGLRLELHVIGSSHQVILATAARDLLIETFACPPAQVPAQAPAHAPTTATTPLTWDAPVRTHGAWAGLTRHEFRCTRTAHPAEFRTSVAEALDRVRAHDRHVVARFPGDRDALTALALTTAGPGHLAWETWHVYPQHSEIVRTTTALTGAPGPATASARGGR